MISASDIKIHISGKDLVSGEIAIPRGSIVVVKGDSGSGKSSLLYFLALFSSHGQGSYQLDGNEVDIHDEATCAALRRRYSFLFQDNALLDKLTVLENVQQAAASAGISVSAEQIIAAIKRVNLSEECIGKYPRQLSGGEQQRVALACALVRDSEYLFVDEPTASLDEQSTQIVLQVLAEEAAKGKGICIASHDSRVWNITDRKFEIVDGVIKSELSCDAIEETQTEVPAVNLKNAFSCFKYARLQRKREKSSRGIVSFLCALAVVGFVLLGGVLRYLKDTHDGLVKQVSDREIFVVNLLGTRESVLDSDGNPGITEEEMRSIAQFDGVETIYPFFEFYDSSFSGTGIHKIREITVRTKGEERKVMPLGATFGTETYSVLPFYKEQNIEDHIVHQFSQEAECYISTDLARALGVEDLKDELTISLWVWVPVGKYVMESSTDTIAAQGEFNICRSRELTVKVGGIIGEEYNNRFSVASENLLFLSFDLMDTVLQEMLIGSAGESFEKDAAGHEIKAWNPSAAVVYVDSQSRVKIVSSKIERINGSFSTRCDYSNAKKLEEFIKDTRSVSRIVVILVVFIIFVLMFILFMNYTLSRNKEFALLKVYGISRRGIILITVMDGILYACTIIVLALLMCGVAWVIGNAVLAQGAFTVDRSFMLMIPFMTVGFVLAPMLVSAGYAARLKVDNVMRY